MTNVVSDAPSYEEAFDRISSKLVFHGQIFFTCSRRSRRLVAERMSRGGPRTNWLVLAEPSFATSLGPRSVGVADWQAEVEQNDHGGEESSVSFTTVREIYRRMGDVTIMDVHITAVSGPGSWR